MNSTSINPESPSNCSPDYSYSDRLDVVRWSMSWIGIVNVFYIVVMVVVSLSAVFHASFIIVLAKNRRLHSRYNLLVVGLTISDLVTSGVLAPIRLYRVFVPEHVSITFCKFLLAVKLWTNFASLFIITSIAVFRALVVIRPTRPQTSASRILIVIVVTFALSSAHAVKFFPQDYNHYLAGLCNGPIYPCATYSVYLFGSTITVYIACTIVVIISYITIAVINSQNINRLHGAIASSINRRLILGIKSGAAIFIDIVVSMSLFLVIVTYPRFTLNDDVAFNEFVAGHFVTSVPLISSVLHPIVYFYNSARFRTVYWKFWRRRRIVPIEHQNSFPLPKNMVFTVHGGGT